MRLRSGSPSGGLLPTLSTALLPAWLQEQPQEKLVRAHPPFPIASPLAQQTPARPNVSTRSRHSLRRLLGRAGLLVGSGWLAACASVAPPGGLAGSTPADGQDIARILAQNDRLARQPDRNDTGFEVYRPAANDLWQRIRAGFAFPELDSPLVAEKERFYLQRPEYLQRMFSRGARYLHHIVEEVEKRGLPTELALLPFVESAMNPTALSSAKAAGLWQFIPSTGRQYDLAQNWWVDNRRDVVQSTRAALDYLETIHRMQGNDWFLALASYNWGEGSVRRAMRANQAAGKPTGYLDLRMPAETRHYIPKLIAIKHIVQHADRLGLALPELPNTPYFATIENTRPIDMALAARFAGMSEADFIALNPAHNRPVISARRNSVLKIPADRVEQFHAAAQAHQAAGKPFVSWHPHTLRAGESIDQLARQAGMPAKELLQANGIAAGTRVLPGTRLLVRNAKVRDDALIAQFQGPRIYKQINAGPLVHKVRRGDTGTAIARRYGLSLTELGRLNRRVKLGALRPGMKLTVRRNRTQTVMIAEDGSRHVMKGQVASSSQASTSSRRQQATGGRAAIRKVSYTPPRSKAGRSSKVGAAIRGTRATQPGRSVAAGKARKTRVKADSGRKTVAVQKNRSSRKAAASATARQANRHTARLAAKARQARSSAAKRSKTRSQERGKIASAN